MSARSALLARRSARSSGCGCARSRRRSRWPPSARARFFWIPDPKSNAASLTWELADGQRPVARLQRGVRRVSPSAILSAIFLPLGGFYLSRARCGATAQRGVGAILAATPLSKTAYLGGKLAAHFAYLLVLDLLRARDGARRVSALRSRAVLALVAFARPVPRC